MAGITLHTVLDHLRRLHTRAETAQRSDRELLHAFATNRDQDAFAVVVRRHAALVWGVCRRILGHQQDAEDAFQATFVILARRAGSVRWRPSVGGWLHTVAQRLAVRVRRQAEQRRFHEREASRTPPVDSSLRELAAVVDEELQRLPVKYREPLLLHYWEGMTAESAARQLGMSRALFYKRLNRGREMLREGLQRQGLSLTAPLLAAVLTPEAEAASHSLIQTTLRGVMGNVPERVAILAAEAIGFTAVVKLKIGVALALLLGLAAGGVAMMTSQTKAPTPQAERPAESPKAEEKSARRVDRYGDPLPKGAVARLGTLRWRACGAVGSLTFTPDGKTIISGPDGDAPMSGEGPPIGLCLLDAMSGKRIKSIRPPGTIFVRIALSADGKRLAAACTLWPDDDRFKSVVQILELPSGRKLQEWTLQELGANELSWLGWSSNGQPLAAYAHKGAIRLLDVATGRERRFAVNYLSNSPICAVGQNLLAASEQNDIVHVWNLANGKERCAFKAGGQPFHGLVFSPNERWLAALIQKVPGEYSLGLWDTATGKAVHRVAPEQKYIDGIAFSPDGKMLATVGSEEVCFWDVASGRKLGRIKEEGQFVGSPIAFSPDGKTLAASGFYSPAIHLWDVSSGTMKPQAQGHTNRPHPPSFSPDGKRVATSSGTIFIWDPETGEPRLRIRRSGRDAMRELGYCVFSADGRRLYSLFENQLIFFDAASGRELHTLKIENPQRPNPPPRGKSLHLAADRARIIAVSDVFDSNGHGPNEMLVSGWDTSTRKQLFQYRHPRIDYAFSADGHMLAASSNPTPQRQASGPMRLEDAETGELLFTFPALEGQTWPLAFSPDDRLLASFNLNWERKDKKDDPAGATGSALHLWETMTATEVLALPLEALDQDRTAFSPDGRVLALIAPGGDLLLWDLRRGKELRRFKDFDAQVASLVFSPDGRRLVSGLSDSTLLVWDVGQLPAASAEKHGAERAAKAWADLAGKDAPRAFRARGALASAPEEAMAVLKKHLHPARPADPQRLRRLLTELESDQFAVREKAQEELQQLGDLADPALRQVMDNKPTLEMRRRVQALLEGLRGPVTRPELLQALRAVAVLEDIGTPEARRLLEQLAKGTPEARLTREAKASLRRLDLRKPDKP